MLATAWRQDMQSGWQLIITFSQICQRIATIHAMLAINIQEDAAGDTDVAVTLPTHHRIGPPIAYTYWIGASLFQPGVNDGTLAVGLQRENPEPHGGDGQSKITLALWFETSGHQIASSGFRIAVRHSWSTDSG